MDTDLSRREQYAELTREAILTAARELFSKRGYFSTTVEEIAKVARVAPVTVYASAGGKSGLLRTLADQWSQAPLMRTNRHRMLELDEPTEIIRIVAETARRLREEYGDIVILMLATAPHDKDVSESLDLATARYRDSIREVVQKLAQLEALREDLTEEDGVDILWFYFGYWGLYNLHVENQWSYDRAEGWLWNAATKALLRPVPLVGSRKQQRTS